MSDHRAEASQWLTIPSNCSYGSRYLHYSKSQLSTKRRKRKKKKKKEKAGGYTLTGRSELVRREVE